MYLIKRRLEREYGMRGVLFNYPSIRGTLDENAEALANFIDEQDAATVHVIGHSLGGVLALRTAANHGDLADGRIVCLGSPLSGSRAGRVLDDFDWVSPLVGYSLPEGVIDASASEWAAEVASERDIGSIAGTVPFGLGQIVANFGEDNDGTVAVSETCLDGLKDHIVMDVSHKGLLLSVDVHDQAAAFLMRGEFVC